MSETSGQQLPPGWCWTTSGKLFDFVTSGSRGWAKYYAESGALFLRMGNLDHDSISLDLADVQRVKPPKGAEGIRTKVEPGDLLISITADVGMTGLVSSTLEKAYINQHVALARPVRGICAAYLAWYLASASGGQKQFKALQRGATKVGLGLDDIGSVRVPMAPLAEQEAIVALIDELLSDLDAGVIALGRVQAKLRHYRAAVLKAAVEGALTTEWRAQQSDAESAFTLLDRVLTERRHRWEVAQLEKFKAAGKEPPTNWKAKYEEPALPDTTNLPPLPVGWCWASLDQLVGDAAIGLDRGLQYQKTTSPGSPYVKMNNVTMNGRVTFADLAFVEPTEDEQQRYSLIEGDLLFNTRNSKELVGKIGIVRQPPASAVYNNNLMRLRFDGAALPAFICNQMLWRIPQQNGKGEKGYHKCCSRIWKGLISIAPRLTAARGARSHC